MAAPGHRPQEDKRARLYSRPGNDLTDRFPFIVEALAKLRSRSCIIDGEAVAFGDDGIPSFDRIRYRRHDTTVFLYAFDLIELDGEDLRRDPLTVRKATLASVLARAVPGLRSTEHLEEEDGPLVFQHACKLGLGGIVSKRRHSFYSSGRSPHSKNPNAQTRPVHQLRGPSLFANRYQELGACESGLIVGTMPQ
jgi:bifunctional non-homologous end joining protein LigD